MILQRTLYIRYAVFSLAFLGLAGGYLMVPSDDEVAFLNFKDKNFKNALARYEAQYEAGSRSPSMIGPLCDLYLQYGMVDKAIKVLEENLYQLPNELEVRYRLSTYYRYAQRPADYQRNLEAISRLVPSKELLRELAQIYNYNEEYDLQVLALQRIIAEFHPDHEDYINLAYLFASQKRFDEVYQVVEQLIDNRFQEMESGEVEFALSIMLDLGRADQALDFALQVIQGKKGHYLERISLLFRNRGALPLAYRLLQPYETQEKLPEGILLALVSIQIAQGMQDKAYERMSRNFKAGTLPAGLTQTYLELLLDRDDGPRVKEFVQYGNLSVLTEGHLLRLAKRMMQLRLYPEALALKARLSKTYLAEQWLVGAVLEVVGQGPNAAAASLAVDRNGNLEDWRKIFLARVYHELAFGPQAKGQLERVTSLADVRFLDMVEVIEMYITYGLSAQASRLIDQEKHRVAGKELVFQLPILYAWMLNQAALGQTDSIRATVKGLENPPLDLYRQLYFAGVRFSRRPLALEAAQWFAKAQPSEEANGYLANGLLLNQDYPAALVLLQRLYGKNKAEWLEPYAETLYALGRKEEWRQIWLNEAKHPGVTQQRRQEIAFIFLDKSYKTEAEEIFLSQAQNEGPQSSAVEQLLFLWGLRPAPEKIDWLVARLNKAEPKDQVGWYRRLIQVGQGERLVEAVEKGQHQDNKPLMDLYLEYLQGQPNRAKFFEKLSLAVAEETDLERLKKLANMAGNQPLAEKAFKKLLVLMPTDKESIAQLGITAYNQGRFTDAEGYFNEAIAQGLVDAKVYFYLGQLLNRKEDPRGKELSLEALAILKVSAKNDMESKLIMAQIYWDQKQREKTIGIYKELIASHPLEISLKANLANLLLEVGKIDEAEELIGAH
ncbi:MAG: hypothetical protein A2600_08795 [Candidatus Lambdaproteobacteria bacterium RIFOXYD1_FULL_56_27]|uniref:Tetratricopeptide repeat-like domain-containing protein n=1 Tax=Candidatus Lambdaproteobacteria bacterium RIFOXYD2_FULL_56_26 TaxID=1817773 RepID=A0A1F6GYY3_9PROT|nr:MAG: hypothetical protein A2426_10215 [Candidatus Lambdaproteobacteria bacterium RIFOXYC1_FULL_56_13]OGH03367.1 MAG: hypothetical protein A2557_02470 [Candidatus Lambdaproteobacteria bacterium RIFOXYD2_FULL_56_26]OGH06628.1 MAG: hypothetical protein A2600_08795 [Candidatus Lambdaproteobacteria bacterium RIFOXYD1_FULL_56_27]